MPKKPRKQKEPKAPFVEKATDEERRAMFDRLVVGGWMDGYLQEDTPNTPEGEPIGSLTLQYSVVGGERMKMMREALAELKIRDWTDAEWGAFREMILEQQWYFGLLED